MAGRRQHSGGGKPADLEGAGTKVPLFQGSFRVY